MKIGILGTRGIPNNYGGFEEFAESLAVFLVQKNHEVIVYNSSNHPYYKSQFKGAQLVHCYDPENNLGTIGQFIYDFNCILDSRKKNFDIILQLGYTSSSVWSFLLPKKPIIITNMDGMEWKRDKYSFITKRFLMLAEKLAVNNSDYLIADSTVIQDYLKNKYKRAIKFIPYGSNLVSETKESTLDFYNIKKNEYVMLISRFERENNIDMILEGYVKSKNEFPFLVIGNFDDTGYGKLLKSKYTNNKNIKFLGGIFDKKQLDNLRYFSRFYFHGHSVGGTNPSLIDAMASKVIIIAHDNAFNRAVLKQDGFYFKNSADIDKLLHEIGNKEFNSKINSNMKKIETYYNSDNINNEYLDFFNECN